MLPEHPSFQPQLILEVLARHRVRCVVIGAYAAVLAGAEVLTADIDITPATDDANLARLAAALGELHAAIRVGAGEPPVPLPADPRLLARTEILNLVTDAGALDITVRPDGTTGYDDLRRNARAHGAAGDLYVTVAALEDVIRSKAAAGRAKDMAALPQLRAVLERRNGPRGPQPPEA